jgi:hypothetical protein
MGSLYDFLTTLGRAAEKTGRRARPMKPAMNADDETV